MHSPGAPSLRREVERQFWVQIATGITSEKAAEAVGRADLQQQATLAQLFVHDAQYLLLSLIHISEPTRHSV
jgi:hypothetical protein